MKRIEEPHTAREPQFGHPCNIISTDFVAVQSCC